MNYKELQNQLKTFKSQGFTTIALNAKKDILENEYNRVMNAIIKEAINSEPDIFPTNEAIIEDTEAMNEAVTIATEIIEDNEIEPSQVEIKGLSSEQYTVKSNDNEAFEDLTANNEAQISEVSIAESTLSINSESMAMNEAVTNPPEIEITSKEFFEALSKLVIIFVSSIVKLWVKVNRISQLVSGINEARADIKTFMQWYFSGFKFPEFV